MPLNCEQTELKEKLLTFINSKNTGYFGIYGGGGVGKTYTICNSLSNFRGSIVFLGATNKVTTVLKNGLENSGFHNPKIKTIDSFLKFKIERDHENKPTISYTFPSRKNIPDLIVIDEISLISYQKFQLLEKLKDSCKLILLGDYLQLPPIEEEKINIVRNKDGFQVSRIFLEIPEQNTFTLTIQNRQKEGTALFDLVSGFRQNMSKKMSAIVIAEKKHNGSDILYFDNIRDRRLHEEIKNGECVAVCFKNLSVLNYNWLIGSTKTMRKDYRLNEMNEGDELMFDQFYIHEKTNFYTSNIVKVEKITKNITEEFKIKEGMVKMITYNLFTVIDTDLEVKQIRYIHGGLYGPNGGGLSQSVYGQRKTYSGHIAQGKNVNENKKYLTDLNTRFAKYQNSFAKLKRPYAITCHKAQGSTYGTVLIPVYDFFTMNYLDTNQLLYVAMSRAKERIIFVNKKEQFDNTSNRKLFSEFEKQSIASSQDYKCKGLYCGNDLVDREFDVDHITPIAKGGKNAIENLQALCKKCHKNKTAKEKF